MSHGGLGEAMRLDPADRLREAHPGLVARLLRAEDVHVRRRHDDLEAYKEAAVEAARRGYTLEGLKDEPRIRAYRDFFWRVGIDPTKTRPASEALLRRVLQGRPLPRVNTLVDAYNLASLETRVALAAFDAATLAGDLRLRPAEAGEPFLGIGMDDPVALQGREIVVEDDQGLVAVYPYRDADRTKVTLDTHDAVLMVCGVPGLKEAVLEEAARRTGSLVERVCGGAVRSVA